MAEKTGDAYGYCYQNPVKLVDPTGMAPTDIVYFNMNGQEIGRWKSNKEFNTIVFTSSKGFGGPSAEAPMPNVITTRTQTGEDVQAPKYQENDYQIAASTYLTNLDLNSGKMVVSDRGGNVIPQSDLINVPDISVDTVKAWSMQESHAGTTGSILQVNNNGDYTKDKATLGITKDMTFTAHYEINLAIRYAIGKGFSTSKVEYTDNGKTVNRSYKWNGWSAALKGYGPGVKNPNYQDYINTMQTESIEPKSKNYKTP